ncbi:MAG: hypothetical protein U0795_20185 [Pirellulales bacterium]
MQSFSDRSGTHWELEITAGSVRKRILARLGVDLLEPERDSEKLLLLVSSTARLMDLIWCLVESQAAAKGVSDEDAFWDRFDAEQLATGIRAAKEELDFFIRTSQPQSTVPVRLRKAAVVEELERQHVVAFLESDEVETLVSAELGQQLDRAAEQLKERLRSHASSTSWPDTSAPTSSE